MEKLLIRGARVYREGRFQRADVLCDEGVICALGEQAGAAHARTLEAQGLMLVPGFIDAHTHGCVGVDVNMGEADGLRRMAAFFASQGVTSFLASVLTDTPEQTEQCLAAIAKVMGEQTDGAQLLGAHLEGPFLSQEYKGAMPAHLLREGDVALLRGYQERYPGVIRYLTVSPEVPGVTEMIGQIAQELTVAIGHSGADYACAMEAIRRGARCVTHTFNAMRLFHQHEPGIMGAALESDCYCEAICDGRHLHPGAVRLLLKCKGFGRVMAVTDSIMATGLPDGKYKLGVNDVTVIDGDAKLTATGVRAGSTLTAAQALRNLTRFTGRPVEDVLPLLTENPASALRLQERKGRIALGMDADLTLLDEGLNVCATIAGGRMVYAARE